MKVVDCPEETMMNQGPLWSKNVRKTWPPLAMWGSQCGLVKKRTTLRTYGDQIVLLSNFLTKKHNLEAKKHVVTRSNWSFVSRPRHGTIRRIGDSLLQGANPLTPKG